MTLRATPGRTLFIIGPWDDRDTPRWGQTGCLFRLHSVEQQISEEFARRFIHISAEEYRNEMFDPARSAKNNPQKPE